MAKRKAWRVSIYKKLDGTCSVWLDLDRVTLSPVAGQDLTLTTARTMARKVRLSMSAVEGCVPARRRRRKPC